MGSSGWEKNVQTKKKICLQKINGEKITKNKTKK